MANFNPTLPKYTQSLCVSPARPVTNVLQENQKRKDKHVNPQQTNQKTSSLET